MVNGSEATWGHTDEAEAKAARRSGVNEHLSVSIAEDNVLTPFEEANNSAFLGNEQREESPFPETERRQGTERIYPIRRLTRPKLTPMYS